jgi:hypothetical protein
MGRANEYNVDAVRCRWRLSHTLRVRSRVCVCAHPPSRRQQIPKFIMANGKMVQMLIHTDVVRTRHTRAHTHAPRRDTTHKAPQRLHVDCRSRAPAPHTRITFLLCASGEVP